MSKWKCDICGTEFDNFQAQGFDNKIYCPLCFYKHEFNTLNKGIDELIEKCNKKIYYEKREISNNHNSFDHSRIIANCEEIIQDLKKLKGE